MQNALPKKRPAAHGSCDKRSKLSPLVAAVSSIGSSAVKRILDAARKLPEDADIEVSRKTLDRSVFRNKGNEKSHNIFLSVNRTVTINN